MAYPVNLNAAGLSGIGISVDDLTESGWITGSANLNGLRSAFVWRPDGAAYPDKESASDFRDTAAE